MKILMEVSIPHETFNEAVQDGSANEKMGRIMEHMKPESAYFTTMDGYRGGYFVVNMDNASQIPSMAEPWFLIFGAEVNFKPVMSPEDLQNANLEQLGKDWG